MNYLKPILLILLLAAVIGGFGYQWQNKRQHSLERDTAALEQGIGLFEQKRHEEALEVFESLSVEALPDWRLPYYRGSLLVIMKQFERAIPDLETALRMRPGEGKVMFALGVAHYKLGQISISRAYFAQVLEVDPGNDDARGLMDIMANLERQSADTP